MNTMQFWTPWTITSRWVDWVIECLDYTPYPQFNLQNVIFHVDTQGGDTVATKRLIEKLLSLRNRVTVTTIAEMALSSGALLFLAGENQCRHMYSGGSICLHGVSINTPVYVLGSDGRVPTEELQKAVELNAWVERFVRSRIADMADEELLGCLRTPTGLTLGCDAGRRHGLVQRIFHTYKEQTFPGF